MLKKLLVTSLIVVILTVVSGVNSFAQSVNTDENQAVAKQENSATSAGDLKSAISAKSKPGEVGITNKSTLAEYERSKRQGKGLSTTTKVLIVVGIVAAVTTVIFVAGRKDLENNILR